MRNFIELTSYDGYRAGEKVSIPVAKIQLIKQSSRDTSTYIWIDGMKYELNVLESVATIRRLLEDES